MYIVEINNHGTICKEKFIREEEYDVFTAGVLFVLELTNAKYTYEEITYQVEWITKVTFNIL